MKDNCTLTFKNDEFMTLGNVINQNTTPVSDKINSSKN
jgi:hypothetical protein